MEKEGPKHKQSKEELERASETQRDREALRPPFSIDAFVLLPDHLHCIWTLARGDAAFSRRWRLIKGAFSRKHTPEHIQPLTASRREKKEQAVWQRRFWEHVIRGYDFFWNDTNREGLMR